MELLLMLDAARGASAAQITAVIPHYAYARSDKKDASRISLGGRLVADMLVDRGRRPGADDDAARAAGARLLLGAGRPPHRHRRAGRPLPRPRPRQHRRRLPRPRQRQDRHPVRPAARAAGGRRVASSGWPTTGWSSTRSSATSRGKRAIVLDDEIATGGSIVELLDGCADAGLHRAPRSPARTGCSPARPSAAARPPDDQRGRSDATLNRGGVRMGTGEFYEVVEELDEVLDSLVVHLEDAEGGAGELLLFVVLRDGTNLDDELRARIGTTLRTSSRRATSPTRSRPSRRSRGRSPARSSSCR